MLEDKKFFEFSIRYSLEPFVFYESWFQYGCFVMKTVDMFLPSVPFPSPKTFSDEIPIFSGDTDVEEDMAAYEKLLQPRRDAELKAWDCYWIMLEGYLYTASEKKLDDALAKLLNL